MPLNASTTRKRIPSVSENNSTVEEIPAKKIKIDTISSSTVSSEHQDRFEVLVDKVLPTNDGSNDRMNKLKHVFILKNRIIKNASDLQLWTTYLRSGTSQLNEGHYNIGSYSYYWPDELKQYMIQNGITSNATNQTEEGEGEINDGYLLFYTQKKVSHLENEQTRLQTLLAKVIESIQPHVVLKIDEIIDYHHKKLQLTLNGDSNAEKICHIEYNYSDRIWKFKFPQLNPSDYQVQ